MAENQGINLFGFEIRRAGARKAAAKNQLDSIVPPTDDDGAGYVTASGSHFGQYVNLDGDESKDNVELIRQYRGVAMHPEVDAAIEDIVNEAVTIEDKGLAVKLVLDDVEASDKIKKEIQEEFSIVLNMLKFNDLGHDIFRRFYVDGRIYHHLVVNDSNLKAGIQEIRPIDATKIRKVKEIKTKKDPLTGAKIIEKVDEHFIYQDKPGQQVNGIKLTADSVSYVTSGLLDESRKKVVSYLHKALKPINQLRMMEDSLVIYRLARAPERRIFYIDVGNMPRGKSEEYMKNIMTKYRNKLVYDANTGKLKDDRKHMSMLEDFWLPRREGGRGTEISTLPGGENLGQIDDIIYFQKRLYRSLNVPSSRLEQEQASGLLGRSTEINRDELKFQKFIDRLRRRFSGLFLEILRKQLVLKGTITNEDWEAWRNELVVDFVSDNHFAELRNAELVRERLQTLDMTQQYVGEFYSKEWVFKNILNLSQEEMEEMKKQMAQEEADGEVMPDEDGDTDYDEPKSAPVEVKVVPDEKEEKPRVDTDKPKKDPKDPKQKKKDNE
tara:strand:- start:908 stop:2563 length:1656 start_codon:yes stop_codon:yes gene_type:complete